MGCIKSVLNLLYSEAKAKSWSNTQDIDVLLGEFLHGKTTIKTVLCYVALLCVGLGILQAVVAHLGVCIVDGVDENENHRGDHHGDCHKACNQGQVVHCCKRKKINKQKQQLSITINGNGVYYDIIQSKNHSIHSSTIQQLCSLHQQRSLPMKKAKARH